MNTFENIRSKCQAGSWAEAYHAALEVEGPERDVARRLVIEADGYDVDAVIEAIARECVWSANSMKGRHLWDITPWRWGDYERAWIIEWRGCAIASNETIDLQAIQQVWAIGPVWEQLHVWEDWASKFAPGQLDVPRDILTVKWQQCCEGTPGNLLSAEQKAVNGALHAVSGPSVSPFWDARAASRVAWAAWRVLCGDAQDVAIEASLAAMLNETRTNPDPHVRDTVYASAYVRYCSMFARYVVSHVMEQELHQ